MTLIGSVPDRTESDVTMTVVPGATIPATARLNASGAWNRCHSWAGTCLPRSDCVESSIRVQCCPAESMLWSVYAQVPETGPSTETGPEPILIPLRNTTAWRSVALTMIETGPSGDRSGCQSLAPAATVAAGAGFSTISGVGATRGVTARLVM